MTAGVTFGCSGLAGLYEPVSSEQAAQVLEAAWEHGLRDFDTAPHYGNGMSERRIGDFLRDRTGWTLSTKVGRVLEPLQKGHTAEGFKSGLPFGQHFDFSASGVERSVADSFQRLGLNKIDTLYVHDILDPDVETDTPAHLRDLLDSGAPALSALKSSGVVSAIGIGVNTVAACMNTIGRMEIDRIMLAGRLTPLDRSALDKVVPLCAEHDIDLVIGGVFNSGILATGPGPDAHFDYLPASDDVQDRTRRIVQICERFGVPISALALQFPARFKVVSDIVIGTSKVSSLTRNLLQINAEIPQKLWDELDAEMEAGTI
ncbi:aldo/keto reductase [Litoreibacter albidus]|uniref:D-threo-aldose 1-dehydrogenase n=1 Tax=Litoreibacter albidus TaxID=670155 RepID=A0A1H3DG93_9RHOB|nr:aldo/keto reductase [Litoreibacter albidus]SDX65350.1 D-threo-aldose 1-dehydrogenase [Litoreibacter albidus]